MTTKHKLQGTPIGQLFDMGLNDTKISEITKVTSSGSNKWRNGTSCAGVSPQMRAKGYLDGLNSVPRPAQLWFDTPAELAKIEAAKPKPDPKADALYLIAVSADQFPRFAKLMTIGGFEFVDVDK